MLYTIEITAFACNMPFSACCMPHLINWCPWNKASLSCFIFDWPKTYFIIFGLLPHL